MLQKGVYPHKYMDDWEKFNDISIPEKQNFYSHLNIQGITDAGYAHAKRVCKDFKITNLRDYHDLYVKAIHYC